MIYDIQGLAYSAILKRVNQGIKVFNLLDIVDIDDIETELRLDNLRQAIKKLEDNKLVIRNHDNTAYHVIADIGALRDFISKQSFEGENRPQVICEISMETITDSYWQLCEEEQTSCNTSDKTASGINEMLKQEWEKIRAKDPFADLYCSDDDDEDDDEDDGEDYESEDYKDAIASSADDDIRELFSCFATKKYVKGVYKASVESLAKTLSEIAKKKSMEITAEEEPSSNLWNTIEYEDAVMDRLEFIIKSDKHMGRKGAIKKTETYLEAVRDTHDRKMVQIYERLVYELKGITDSYYRHVREQLIGQSDN